MTCSDVLDDHSQIYGNIFNLLCKTPDEHVRGFRHVSLNHIRRQTIMCPQQSKFKARVYQINLIRHRRYEVKTLIVVEAR